MHNNFNAKEIAGLSFQVDLLNLNFNLADNERSLASETKAHETALIQIRSLAKSS